MIHKPRNWINRPPGILPDRNYRGWIEMPSSVGSLFKFLINGLLLCLITWVPTEQAISQSTMPDSVFVGVTKDYWVVVPPESSCRWWLDGMLQTEGQPLITIHWEMPGIHILEVQELPSAGCDGDIQAGMVVVVPDPLLRVSAFTPDGDGLNDVFNPVMAGLKALTSFYNFRVYNKRGQLLYETSDPDRGWDGYYNKVLSPPGSYFYQLKITIPGYFIKSPVTGTVMLIR